MTGKKMQIDLRGSIKFLKAHYAELTQKGWNVHAMTQAAQTLLDQGVREVDCDHESQKVIFLDIGGAA